MGRGEAIAIVVFLSSDQLVSPLLSNINGKYSRRVFSVCLIDLIRILHALRSYISLVKASV